MALAKLLLFEAQFALTEDGFRTFLHDALYHRLQERDNCFFVLGFEPFNFERFKLVAGLYSQLRVGPL